MSSDNTSGVIESDKKVVTPEKKSTKLRATAQEFIPKQSGVTHPPNQQHDYQQYDDQQYDFSQRYDVSEQRQKELKIPLECIESSINEYENKSVDARLLKIIKHSIEDKDKAKAIHTYNLPYSYSKVKRIKNEILTNFDIYMPIKIENYETYQKYYIISDDLYIYKIYKNSSRIDYNFIDLGGNYYGYLYDYNILYLFKKKYIKMGFSPQILKGFVPYVQLSRIQSNIDYEQLKKGVAHGTTRGVTRGVAHGTKQVTKPAEKKIIGYTIKIEFILCNNKYSSEVVSENDINFLRPIKAQPNTLKVYLEALQVKQNPQYIYSIENRIKNILYLTSSPNKIKEDVKNIERKKVYMRGSKYSIEDNIKPDIPHKTVQEEKKELILLNNKYKNLLVSFNDRITRLMQYFNNYNYCCTKMYTDCMQVPILILVRKLAIYLNVNIESGESNVDRVIERTIDEVKNEIKDTEEDKIMFSKSDSYESLTLRYNNLLDNYRILENNHHVKYREKNIHISKYIKIMLSVIIREYYSLIKDIGKSYADSVLGEQKDKNQKIMSNKYSLIFIILTIYGKDDIDECFYYINNDYKLSRYVSIMLGDPKHVITSDVKYILQFIHTKILYMSCCVEGSPSRSTKVDHNEEEPYDSSAMTDEKESNIIKKERMTYDDLDALVRRKPYSRSYRATDDFYPTRNRRLQWNNNLDSGRGQHTSRQAPFIKWTVRPQ